MVTVMVMVFTTDGVFDLRPDETLLEGLERNGYEVEYQCRSGYCGACRMKIVVGSVDYPQPPLAFTAPDEILPCCCRATQTIKVECQKNQTIDRIQNDMFAPDLLQDLENKPS